jgi:hypothetical protein
VKKGSGSGGSSVYPVCLVSRIGKPTREPKRLDRPDKPERPNRPKKQDRLADIFNSLLKGPFDYSPQSTDNIRGGKVRKIFRKIKKFIHKSLSPASVDNSVSKIPLPLKNRTFLHL